MTQLGYNDRFSKFSANYAMWLCNTSNWETYCDNNVAVYAIGAPSIEMYARSYNVWKNIKPLNGPVEMGWGGKATYGIIIPKVGTLTSNSEGSLTAQDCIEPGPYNMYMPYPGEESRQWFCSVAPSAINTSQIWSTYNKYNHVKGIVGGYAYDYWPIVCLK